jgi:hypothetical protein
MGRPALQADSPLEGGGLNSLSRCDQNRDDRLTGRGLASQPVPELQARRSAVTGRGFEMICFRSSTAKPWASTGEPAPGRDGRTVSGFPELRGR